MRTPGRTPGEAGGEGAVRLREESLSSAGPGRALWADGVDVAEGARGTAARARSLPCAGSRSVSFRLRWTAGPGVL